MSKKILLVPSRFSVYAGKQKIGVMFPAGDGWAFCNALDKSLHKGSSPSAILARLGLSSASFDYSEVAVNE